MATLTATGQEKVQKGYEPLLPGFCYVAFNHLAELEQAVTDKTAAIMLEPIQGEGGVYVADREYLRAVESLCTQKRHAVDLRRSADGNGTDRDALRL